MKKEKILITGGHLTPALAVLEELEKIGYKNFLWVGHKFTMINDKEPSFEYKTVTAKNIPFFNLEAGKLYRHPSLVGIRSFFKIPKGLFQAIDIIIKEKPDLIVSFGGYLALPIVIAGKFNGVKSVTHEQTITVGLSNKIISRLASQIYISWPQSKSFFPPSKTLLTGNPIRDSIYKINGELFEFGNNLPIIYITGGNQGSHIINTTIAEILSDLLPKYNIVHQCGTNTIFNDFQMLTELKEKLTPQEKSRYRIHANINEDEIGTILNKATLVIGRSGANTVYELLALKKFSILIPLPFSTHNEQFLNAKILSNIGLAEIIQQKDLMKDSLLSTINNNIRNITNLNTIKKDELQKIYTNADKLIIPNAAEKIATNIDKLLND